MPFGSAAAPGRFRRPFRTAARKWKFLLNRYNRDFRCLPINLRSITKPDFRDNEYHTRNYSIRRSSRIVPYRNLPPSIY